MSVKKIKNLFLKQSYQDSWEDYQRSLNKEKAVKWDYIILTASNQEQANAYNEQIKARLKNDHLPKTTKYLVIPDPDGKRVGSGGATLNALVSIAKEIDYSFAEKRILIIHSGGDSKRVPQYSACGKLFSPVPRLLPDGRRSTLFDEFIISMSGVAPRIKDGMLVLSGDVLLLFNPLQIDFQAYDSACISFKDSVKVGQHHGVFSANESGFVKEFLHKMPEEELRLKGAVNSRDNVNIDTGAILFSSRLVNALYKLVDTKEKFDKYVNEKVRISFYADFLYPLASESTLEEFYKEAPEGDFSDELTECRTEIWNTLNGYRMKMLNLSPAEFIHFGTTKELLKLMSEDVFNYEFLDWKKRVITSIEDKGKNACSNSYVVDCEIDESSYVEDSSLRNCKIGKNCVISCVKLENKVIEDNTVIHGLKLKDNKYVVRKYTVTTNPKINDMWNQKLYWAADSYEDSYNGKGDYMTSLCESFNNAKTDHILHLRQRIEEEIRTNNFISYVSQRMPICVAEKAFGFDGLSNNIIKLCEKILKDYDYTVVIRAYYYISKIYAKQNNPQKSEYYESLCFETIQKILFKENVEKIKTDKLNKISRDSVKVELPVRVNFGGGWSDTPPYCNDNGGTVLNAAVKLNNEYPIEVNIKKLDKYVVEFESVDLTAFTTITSLEKLAECNNPYDMFALPKAALLACGIVPKNAKGSLEEFLKKLGGGFRITTHCKNIPKGSGLGTSSILSAACVKAIFNFFGKQISESEICTRVLCLEQLMSTGGGWQDQAGGIMEGVKFVTTKPGIVQNVEFQKLELSEYIKEQLQNRFVLIFSGQRRLARNLLREVVGKYIASDSNSVYVLNKIQDVATLMKRKLEKDDFEGFVELINAHWELSQSLDAGCTNTCIDQIFLAIENMIDAKFICGAGGGGFLQVILKKEYTKEQLNERLEEVFQDSGVKVWDSTICF